MRKSTWFEYVEPELLFFKKYIAAQFDPITVDICPNDLTAHKPRTPLYNCMECSHCTSPREVKNIKYITDYVHEMCMECFEDLIIKDNVETSLWSLHYSLIDSYPQDVDATAVPSVLGLVSTLYRADARTGYLMSPTVRKYFLELREALHKKILTFFAEELGETDTNSGNQYMLVRTLVFPGDESFDQEEDAARAVYGFVANEVQAEFGFSVVRTTPDALKLLRKANVIGPKVKLRDNPSKQVLRDMHVFCQDGMSITDAYTCAKALTT